MPGLVEMFRNGGRVSKLLMFLDGTTMLIHTNRDLIDKAMTLEPQGLNRRDELH